MASQHGLYLEDLKEGMSASFTRNVSDGDIVAFAEISGDNNPVHLDDAFAAGTMFKGRIAHGILTASYISTVIGTKLPGPGAIYLSQSLKFRAPVRPGDAVTATCTIAEIDRDKGRVKLDCACTVDGKTVLEGEALIMVAKKSKA